MKQYTKWITTAVAVAGGLAAVSSAQAQPVTGDPYLDNIAPGAVTAYYAGLGQPAPDDGYLHPHRLGSRFARLRQLVLCYPRDPAATPKCG